MTYADLTRQLRGGVFLVGVSLRRLLLARHTIFVMMFWSLAAIAAVAWGLRNQPDFQKLSWQLFLPLHVSFLLPIFGLTYGAAGIAGDREEATLQCLFMTPLWRSTIYLAKSLAALILALAANLATLATLWLTWRDTGQTAWSLFWPAIAMASLAYSSLFMLFSAVFRRATIVGMLYVFFVEVFLAATPGVIRRLSISYFCRCILYDNAADYEIMRESPELFMPLGAGSAATILTLISAGCLLVGVCVFSRREYSRSDTG